MAISKVIYGEDTLIDLTADTVTPETLAAGTTAHNSAGEAVIGTVTMLTVEEITQQAAQKVDKESLGLNNVDNTSDMDKPVSTAQQAALAEKAPAGYGLGETGGVYVENINIVRNGWYRITPSTIGGIGNYALVRVDAQTESSVHQTAYSGMATSTGFIVMKRVCFDGSWGEWEYENPPMVVGNEYRTTERFEGRPVYAKAIRFGNLPAVGRTNIAHNIVGKYANIRYSVQINDSGRMLENDPGITEVIVNDTDVYITTNTDLSEYSVTFILWYTK